jgi:hypothetical protein
MITLAQYVGPHANSPDWTLSREANAKKLLAACARLQAIAESDGVQFPVNPKTGSGVSGNTFGGFRPQNCPQGAPRSNHKQGLGVDLYDPDNEIDAWCMENLDQLVACGIWIEHPSATNTWSHWQCVAPGSGNRVFHP